MYHWLSPLGFHSCPSEYIFFVAVWLYQNTIYVGPSQVSFLVYYDALDNPWVEICLLSCQYYTI